MLKPLPLAALLLSATPVWANWSMERLPADTPSFAVFTNDLGRLSGDTTPEHEILILKTEERQPLGPGGTCSFENCTVSLVVNGQRPSAGTQVNIYFSQGDLMEVPAASASHVFSNEDWDGKLITNQFVAALSDAEWVYVEFDGVSHRFSLSGSSDAFEAVAAATN